MSVPSGYRMLWRTFLTLVTMAQRIELALTIAIEKQVLPPRKLSWKWSSKNVITVEELCKRHKLQQGDLATNTNCWTVANERRHVEKAGANVAEPVSWSTNRKSLERPWDFDHQVSRRPCRELACRQAPRKERNGQDDLLRRVKIRDNMRIANPTRLKSTKTESYKEAHAPFVSRIMLRTFDKGI